MVVAKKYVLAKAFQGFPTDENIQLVEEQLPALQDGEVLFQAEYLTVDPYMRAHSDIHFIGQPMYGQQVAKVIESKHADFQVGQYYLITTGWRSHLIIRPGKEQVKIQPVKNYSGLPVSLALGILGMPGATAYLGFVDLLKPKAGEVVFVNAAAGAVGQVVGQIAKILGCKVIACAGTPDKVKWLQDLGLDVVFNYKTDDLSKILSEAAPAGINCYFDNVGGNMTTTVIKSHMAKYGRIAVCGTISNYNSTEPEKGELPYSAILQMQLSVYGFIVTEYFTPQQWAAAFDQMVTWIKEGKLQYKEHVTEGFENMRKAFYELFTGDNFGKAVIRANLS